LNITPIIIINWNGIQDTSECIESVFSLQNVNYHIHLIDNNSDNEEGNQLKNRYKANQNITCHLYDKNYGFTKAHIKIWEEILMYQSYEYIALLNNDTVVDKHWLYSLMEAAKTYNAEVISSKMINYYNRSIMDNAGHFMLNTGEIMPIGHGKPIDNYNEFTENMGACAGACLYKKSMIEEIGFFDPYFSTGYEDAEFGLRAIVSNFKCIYTPEALVYHKMGQSVKKIFDESYSLMIQTSILYTYFKLMPVNKIIYDIPSIIVKNLSMIIIDLIFLRLNYLRILFKSWFNIWQDRNEMLQNRKIFYDKANSISKFLYLRGKIKWFLPFDMNRFWNILIIGRISSIEVYSDN